MAGPAVDDSTDSGKVIGVVGPKARDEKSRFITRLESTFHDLPEDGQVSQDGPPAVPVKNPFAADDALKAFEEGEGIGAAAERKKEQVEPNDPIDVPEVATADQFEAKQKDPEHIMQDAVLAVASKIDMLSVLTPMIMAAMGRPSCQKTVMEMVHDAVTMGDKIGRVVGLSSAMAEEFPWLRRSTVETGAAVIAELCGRRIVSDVRVEQIGTDLAKAVADIPADQMIGESLANDMEIVIAVRLAVLKAAVDVTLSLDRFDFHAKGGPMGIFDDVLGKVVGVSVQMVEESVPEVQHVPVPEKVAVMCSAIEAGGKIFSAVHGVHSDREKKKIREMTDAQRAMLEQAGLSMDDLWREFAQSMGRISGLVRNMPMQLGMTVPKGGA